MALAYRNRFGKRHVPTTIMVAMTSGMAENANRATSPRWDAAIELESDRLRKCG
jgi:hypothetical protein